VNGSNENVNEEVRNAIIESWDSQKEAKEDAEILENIKEEIEKEENVNSEKDKT